MGRFVEVVERVVLSAAGPGAVCCVRALAVARSVRDERILGRIERFFFGGRPFIFVSTVTK
jgi:hypothetical protein